MKVVLLNPVVDVAQRQLAAKTQTMPNFYELEDTYECEK